MSVSIDFLRCQGNLSIFNNVAFPIFSVCAFLTYVHVYLALEMFQVTTLDAGDVILSKAETTPSLRANTNIVYLGKLIKIMKHDLMMDMIYDTTWTTGHVAGHLT